MAFYAIARLRSGRRWGYAGAADVMSAGAAVSGRVKLLSMDAPTEVADVDPATTLHDVLASTGEGPDTEACRLLDWDALAQRLGPRKTAVVGALALEIRGEAIAAGLRVSQARVTQIKREIGADIVAAWGLNCVADTQRAPAWHRHLDASREKRACRAQQAAA